MTLQHVRQFLREWRRRVRSRRDIATIS